MKTILSSPPPTRLASIDAYRGLVMFLMLAEVLRLCTVSAEFPGNGFWALLCHHQSHVPWIGCSLHDLIQPGFSFLVGVSLPFSIASRQARGQSVGKITQHAVLRSVILIVLGIILSSLGPRGVVWEFFDTLTQIGLGYFFLVLLGFRSTRDASIVLGVVLLGYWLAFALYPLPGSEFDYSKVGVTEEWLAAYGVTGFAAHWQKNSHLAWAFDTWFLNLFPRSTPYSGQANGLATLNFIPLLGTMILGLLAGRVLRSDRSDWGRVGWLAVAGVTGLFTGWLLNRLGICPLAKPIWTPSWVLFSGGWCFLFLGAHYALVDVWGRRWLMFPFIVVGMNSIAAYCLAMVYPAFAWNSLRRIFGWDVFRVFGDAYEDLVYGMAILACYWLILFLMYQKKMFLRI